MRYLLIFFLAPVLFGIGCSAKVDVPAAAEPDSPGVNGSVGQKTASGVELDLSGGGLTKIPSDVFLRTDLVKLDLSENDLAGAPQAEIRHLAKLKFLDLSKNNLTGLPAELGQLKELETLDVSDNQLTGLPMELGDLTQLRVLDISGNPYSTKDLDEIAKKLTQTEIRR
jgi:Leucine-rich repeat (LRR) protein